MKLHHLSHYNQLVKKYIRPDEMIYLVIGDAKTQMDGLKSLGYGDPILLNENGSRVR